MLLSKNIEDIKSDVTSFNILFVTLSLTIHFASISPLLFSGESELVGL